MIRPHACLTNVRKNWDEHVQHFFVMKPTGRVLMFLHLCWLCTDAGFRWYSGVFILENIPTSVQITTNRAPIKTSMVCCFFQLGFSDGIWNTHTFPVSQLSERFVHF